jgi:hypothetical protein
MLHGDASVCQNHGAVPFSPIADDQHPAELAGPFSTRMSTSDTVHSHQPRFLAGTSRRDGANCLVQPGPERVTGASSAGPSMMSW